MVQSEGAVEAHVWYTIFSKTKMEEGRWIC